MIETNIARMSCLVRTGDGAQKSQGWGIARVLVDHALAVGPRCRHAERDGFVELSAPGLHGHYR